MILKSVKSVGLVAVASTGLLLCLPASAEFAKPEDAIKYRQSALSVIGHHFGSVAGMVNGKIPFDAKAAQHDADVIASLAKLPWGAFGPGTDQGVQHKTKPGAWAEQAKFQELADKFVAESVKLAAAAKTGDLASLKAAFGPTAGTCKACHDPYKER